MQGPTSDFTSDFPFVNWTAFPNGTDGFGNLTEDSWYERINKPGAPAFLEAAQGECQMFLVGPQNMHATSANPFQTLVS